MRTLLQAGARVQQAFERRGWQFCFIGGVANFRWGTPRLTNDLDLTLLTGFGGEAAYAAALLAEFESRIPDAAAFAARPQDWVDMEGVILKAPELPDELGRIAQRAETVIGPFDHKRPE